MTAVDMVNRALDLLTAHEMPAFADLFAPDGVMEFPMAPQGATREVRGTAALHAYLDEYSSVLDVRSIAAKTVHPTTDPEVAIVEFEAHGIVVATQVPYEMVYIAVITVRDDAIVRYRDYWSPAAAAEIMGSDTALAGGRTA